MRFYDITRELFSSIGTLVRSATPAVRHLTVARSLAIPLLASSVMAGMAACTVVQPSVVQPSIVPPAVLQVTWPLANESIDASPILQWQPVTNVAEYRVTVTTLGGGTSIFAQTTMDANVSVTPALSSGDYSWRVQALDSQGRSVADVTSTFYVKDSVDLVAPEGGAEVGAEPLLQWCSYPGATTYQILVLDDAAYPPVVLLDRVTTETQLAMRPAVSPGSYSWTVWAFDGSDKLVAELTSTFVVSDDR